MHCMKTRNEEQNVATPVNAPTRRQMIFGSAIALGSFAVGSAGAQNNKSPQKMAEVPSTGVDAARTSLHQEIDLKAGPQRVYEALLDSKQFAAFTGMPAEINREAGGAFTTFGGLIAGRNIELVTNQRIVQAWRPTHWDPGVYSIVKFELKKKDSQTTLVLDHTGFPEGNFGHLDSGWYERYWEPLKKYLA
jgi:activator of HSP90 ATPase